MTERWRATLSPEAEVIRAMRADRADDRTFVTECATCHKRVIATIGGGFPIPAGSYILPGHQHDGTHRPELWYRTERIA